MIMIIGGAYQGKLAYAKGLYPDIKWIDGKSCVDEDLFQCGGIFCFHEYLSGKMQAGDTLSDLTELVKKIILNNPEIVIVTDEIGYGIVPADAFERQYRETVGRICTELAGFSKEVYRVVCGIGIKIKG